MSVKKDASGRRSVQVEVEVPGTPEEVWQAIATGPGVSSWFVPTEVEEREGGEVIAHFGPGMDSHAKVTAWEPPHRFAAQSSGLGPDAPAMATEWVVEARSGGTCTVRVVHSLFASGDEWDNQLESIESGWPAFFRILRLYLTNFRGRPCSTFQLMAVAAEPVSQAWDTLTGSLGIGVPELGQTVKTGAGAPPLAGVVEAVRKDDHPYALLLVHDPAPGAVFLNACAMGAQVFISISVYLYGDGAAAAVGRDEPLWQEWLNGQFPPAANPE
ncbi:MAG TPA: SRPBCC domain-containing protein [Bryobacteraceae bacterium]|jgi:uncharacterized protein YndB with AHSA1/START domain